MSRRRGKKIKIVDPVSEEKLSMLPLDGQLTFKNFILKWREIKKREIEKVDSIISTLFSPA